MAQMSLLEDTHASHLVMPGSDEARKTTVISGRKCIDLLKLSGRDGLLPRMCLGTSLWGSTMCYLTWKPKATPGGRLLFQLSPSTPGTAEIESGLLPNYGASPTHSIPTPTAQDYGSNKSTSPGSRVRPSLQSLARSGKFFPTPDATRRGAPLKFTGIRPSGAKESYTLEAAAKDYGMMPTPRSTQGGPDFARANREGSGGDDLVTFLARQMLPTPRASDSKGGVTGEETLIKRAEHTRGVPLEEHLNRVMLPTNAGSEKSMGTIQEWGGSQNTLRGSELGKSHLNPSFVEELMGFPTGWTDLED